MHISRRLFDAIFKSVVFVFTCIVLVSVIIHSHKVTEKQNEMNQQQRMPIAAAYTYQGG